MASTSSLRDQWNKVDWLEDEEEDGIENERYRFFSESIFKQLDI